jgi:8-oxo-dGTP pyrophosphatase MutT (NUDIX family)
VRECFEETGFRAEIRVLAYVSESYDRIDDVHFVNAAFAVSVNEGATRSDAGPRDDHVVDVEWVAAGDVASRIVVPVVRDPLVAYLRGEMPQRYAGFSDAGITIRWPTGSE